MTQDVVNILIAVTGAGVGWVLKIVWEAIRALQNEIKSLEKELRTEFLSKDDYRMDINEIKSTLKQIFDKLDKKEDK